jgi:hypothetical protein
MVKGSKHTKKTKSLLKKTARRGSKHHYHNKNKSSTGVKPATKKERAKFVADLEAGKIKFRDHSYVTPFFLTEEFRKGGKPKAFQTPEDLHAAALDYFNWAEENPWHKAEWKDKGLQSIPVKRVFTWDALCLRLGVNDEYFRTFRSQLKKEDPYYSAYNGVIGWIERTIYTNKLEGASGGFYNSNIIAYDLGMKKDMAPIGSVGGVNITVVEAKHSTTLEELKRLLEQIDNEQSQE